MAGKLLKFGPAMLLFRKTMSSVVLWALMAAAQLVAPCHANGQGVPPTIFAEGSRQLAYEKSFVYVTARVTGDDPKQFQWRLNGTNLPNETNFAIFFPSVDVTNAGTYSLVVSNGFGSTTATVTELDVQPFRHNKMIGWNGSSPDGSAGGLLNFDLRDVVDFQASQAACIALTIDGSVFTWGDSWYSLPDDFFSWRGKSYFSPPPGLGNVIRVTVDTSFEPACAWALRADGTVFGWNAETNLTLPINDVVDFAASDFFNKLLLLKRDGTLATWDGTAMQSVVGLSNIVSASVGAGKIIALQNDGTVVTPDMDLPTGLTNIAWIAPGQVSYGVRSDGTIAAWSGTDYVEIPAGLTNVLAISSFFQHYVAILSDGSLMTWGNVSDPTPVVTNAFAVRAGLVDLALIPVPYDTNAIHVASQIYNDNVLVGGTSVLTVNAESRTPIHYQWSFAGAPIIDATNSVLTLQNLQLSDTGTYSLLLSNEAGATIRDDIHVSVFPAQTYVIGFGLTDAGITPPGLSNIVAVAAGYDGFTVGLKSDGTIVEWGFAEGSQVVTNISGPPDATNLVTIRAGFFSIVGLRKDGTVVSWSLSGGFRTPSGLQHVTAIDVFGQIGMARKSDGSVVLWGITGDLNISSPLTNIVSVRVGLGLAASDDCAAAIDNLGRPIVFGNFPQPPSGLSNIVDISLDPRISTMGLALHNDGTLTCWGQDCGFTAPPDIVRVFPHAALDRSGNLYAWIWGDTNTYRVATDVIDYSAGSSHSVALTTKLPIPTLAISRNGTNIVASWASSSTWVLESKDDLSNTLPWSPVIGGQVSYGFGPKVSVEVPVTAQRYFRLRLP
jgi:alpha-tubulin suppressor-like RCC1 family protein